MSFSSIKISQLPDGGVILPNDTVAIVRSGVTYQATYPNTVIIPFTSQTTLVLTHNLNKIPVNIILTDDATPPNQLQLGAVEYTSTNVATIFFSGATSGVAYVS